MPNTKPAKKLNAVDQWIADHPYFTFALLGHFIVLMLALRFYDFLLPNTVTPQEREVAEYYNQQSRELDAKQRIDDMEAVKKMLDQLTGQPPKYKVPPDTTAPEAESQQAGTELAEHPSTATEPAEPTLKKMLEQSEQLLGQVQQIHDQVLNQKLDALKVYQADQERLAEDKTEAALTEKQDPADEDKPFSLSTADMARQIGKNQMEARRMFDQIARSEIAKQTGNGLNGDDMGFGRGWLSGGLDPNNPLSVESHFNKVARGANKDLTEDMQTMYTLQGISDSVSQPVELSRSVTGHTVYSRKITRDGLSAERMAINGWYFIGPFPNPNRANLHTRFPPEIGVDLNAVYLGERERLLRWQFIQYDHLPIIPPDFTDFAIYYATTDVYSDTARDVWLDIGSDDQSQLWLNDMLIWRSSDAERVWHTGQGKRKVRLKAGRNTLLFRLENGIQRAAFSVLISSAP